MPQLPRTPVAPTRPTARVSERYKGCNERLFWQWQLTPVAVVVVVQVLSMASIEVAWQPPFDVGDAPITSFRIEKRTGVFVCLCLCLVSVSVCVALLLCASVCVHASLALYVFPALSLYLSVSLYLCVRVRYD